MFRLIIVMLVCCLTANVSFAEKGLTERIQQISNDKVQVWKSVIYPKANQQLSLHRHERDRVVVALDSGVLKITDDKQQAHYLKLVKGQSYYLPRDVPYVMHTDENVGSRVIRVVVVELKD